MRKVGAIGILLLIGLVLEAVALFTDGWIVINLVFTTIYYGIVPYNSYNPFWFNFSSWLMYISFGLYIFVILAYLHAMKRVRHHGCSHSIRHSFNAISSFATVIGIFEIVAFIEFAINTNSYRGYHLASLGYSAYLALVSGIVTLLASGLSQHVRMYDCC